MRPRRRIRLPTTIGAPRAGLSEHRSAANPSTSIGNRRPVGRTGHDLDPLCAPAPGNPGLLFHVRLVLGTRRTGTQFEAETGENEVKLPPAQAHTTLLFEFGAERFE